MTADELKLGDMLEVVGPLDKAWDLYHSELEPYVGQVGKVSYIYEDSVELGFGALRWAFLPENLRHAKADPADELKLGDMLEVVGPLNKEWDLHVSELEPYVGQVGKVSYIYEDSVELDFGAVRWGFLHKNLRHSEAYPADELNIGDMLEVVGPLDKEWDRYTSELEPYVGQVGQISCVNDAYVELDFGRFRWTFLTENLRHAKADPTADAKAVMDVLEKGVTK